jgi:acetylglutamate kinase
MMGSNLIGNHLQVTEVPEASASGANSPIASGLPNRRLPVYPPELLAKVDVLIEALPYIRKFRGKVVVIKYGGNAMPGSDTAISNSTASFNSVVTSGSEAPSSGGDHLSSFAQDIILMRSIGMMPVIIHGGGPQIDMYMSKFGKEPVFKSGRRVTDAETLEIARMVLVGKVNREIVSALNVHGSIAVGLSGEDARLITASHRSSELGFVGDVKVVDPTILMKLVDDGLVPVISTIGADLSGQAYNINADTVAGAIAVAMHAEKLVFLTDIEGIRLDADDPSTTTHFIKYSELHRLLDSHTVTGGMIPKVEACLDSVAKGVRYAHLLDGRIPHVMLLEFFTDMGIGTMIVPDNDREDEMMSDD